MAKKVKIPEKPDHISSYEADKLIIGKTYFTYYMFHNSKFTGLREHVKVFETTLLEKKYY